MAKLKDRLRRRLLGRRLQTQILTDHRTLARLGNREFLRDGLQLAAPDFAPDLEAFEFSQYSQNGEDGIILELLSRLGPAGRRMIEIGIGDGRECNSTNLILNFGWHAELFEINPDDAAKAGKFLSDNNASDRAHVHHVAATPDNVNDLLLNARAGDGFDVLSIDIDSYDYWLWRAVDVTQPRLVVIEYNASLGPERSLTVPYPFESKGIQSYHGASLAALTKLGKEKGYILAGCESRGINAFFVRADLAGDAGIEPVSVEQAYHSHYWRSQTQTVEEQFRAVEHLPWTEV